MPPIDAALITELRGYARECQQLAYTGASDKEHALLRLSRRINARAVELEAVLRPRC